MRKILCLLFAVLLLSTSCLAVEIDTEDIEKALPERVGDTVGDIDDVGDTESFTQRLFALVKHELSQAASGVLKNVTALIVIALICSLLSVFKNDSMPDFIPMCACLAAGSLLVGEMDSYLRLAVDTSTEISLFSKTLLPALCTASAASGCITAATVRYAASALFMDIFIALAETLVIPLVCAYLAAQVAACAFGQKLLSTAASLIKWLCTGLMILVCLGFTLYLGVSSSIAQSGDALAVKLTKTAISSVIPVVGGIISDAASSVAAGAEFLKTSIGAFGIISVIAICISPILKTGLYYLAFKAAAAFSKAFEVPRLSELVSGFASAFGLLFALIASCSLMLFLAIISCMRAVSF